MEFELQHIDIVPSSDPTSRSASQNETPSSMVLDELTKQIEELQNKLKLNYRKLLLYESENQKLIQEKNRFFFESKNATEQAQMLVSKFEKLETHTNTIEQDFKLTSEKLNAYEKLCQAQSIDLKRLSKFHLKIKNIVKPYVETLKTQLTESVEENTRLQQLNEQSTRFIQIQADTIEQLKNEAERQKKVADSEKVSMTRSYEEQIHFLSKEVVEHQQKVHDIEIENLRLKKATETKHYIENELVRFKRVHEADQQTISELKLKTNEQGNTLQSVEVKASDLKNKLTQAETEISTQQALLDNTRTQLSLKIDENEKLYLRIKMFEKLNTSLTISMNEPAKSAEL